MKRILLVLMLVFIVTGCGDSNSFNDVSISVKKGTLTQTGATFILTNHTSNSYTFGEEYVIEQKEGSTWKRVSCDECWFKLSAFILEANQEIELDYNWESTYGTLSKGTYRLVKSVLGDTDNHIYVEFDIN